MQFNEMLDHQKSRCRSGKTNKKSTQHLNECIVKASGNLRKKVVQYAIQ